MRLENQIKSENDKSRGRLHDSELARGESSIGSALKPHRWTPANGIGHVIKEEAASKKRPRCPSLGKAAFMSVPHKRHRHAMHLRSQIVDLYQRLLKAEDQQSNHRKCAKRDCKKRESSITHARGPKKGPLPTGLSHFEEETDSTTGFAEAG